MDDRMNPIAVKEFRQAVQSRGVIVILMLFLLVNLAVIGGYVMTSTDASARLDAGRGIFMGLLGILMFTCVVFVPLYAGGRMSGERNNSDIDLLYITTLSPGAIVRGKYLTATALTLLIFSASMPFMILTYLLRGSICPRSSLCWQPPS
jgi:ABC-type transport system involved in multi-copper enzyme maturation permease subunit